MAKKSTRGKSPKAKSKKNPFLKKVRLFLKSNQGKSFKRKEISKALGVSKPQYHYFREAINELSKSGKIAKVRGGRYTDSVAGRIIRGELQMTSKGFAFVSDADGGEDIFIAAPNVNSAFDRDIVEVQLSGSSNGRSKEGKVVRVVERHRENFVGTFKKSKYYAFVIPDNQKIQRDFQIQEGDEGPAKDGQKVLIRFLEWEPTQSNPQGKVVEVLGFPGEKGVDVSSVALGHGLDLKFSSLIEEAAASRKLKITAKDLANRLDLRDEAIFTVDPPDAKDFDDAISLDILENGHQRLGVHIADVSYFVPEGSELDKEAMKRGTSVYLVDRVIPMLPEHLSNKLCSLQPNVDRMAFSCFVEFDEKLKVVDYIIKPSVINSKRRYTYSEVQDVIDAKGKSKDPFSDVILKMHALSRRLRKNREKSGSIDFETPEVKFKLDKKGKPIEIIPVERMHSNEMIEEFMLVANQMVTKHIYNISPKKDKPFPFIYRVHEKPDAEKLQKFRDFLNALGHKVKIRPGVTPKEFQSVLNGLKGGQDESLIKQVALRTMMKAQYSPKNQGHFGLAFQYYSHFTSPIRRYPDLIVHRLLKEYVKAPSQKRINDLNEKLKTICEITSRRERQAMDAERESVRIKQVEWLYEHRKEEFEGIISGVMSFGLFVETHPYLVEGLVRVENMADDYYIYDEKTYTMIGREFGKKYRLGDPVKVRVKNIDRNRNEVDFVFVE